MMTNKLNPNTKVKDAVVASLAAIGVIATIVIGVTSIAWAASIPNPFTIVSLKFVNSASDSSPETFTKADAIHAKSIAVVGVPPYPDGNIAAFDSSGRLVDGGKAAANLLDAVPDLQAVTDNGATTTNVITIGPDASNSVTISGNGGMSDPHVTIIKDGGPFMGGHEAVLSPNLIRVAGDFQFEKFDDEHETSNLAIGYISATWNTNDSRTWPIYLDNETYTVGGQFYPWHFPNWGGWQVFAADHPTIPGEVPYLNSTGQLAYSDAHTTNTLMLWGGSGAPVSSADVGAVLGTPASGDLSNCIGTASGLTAGKALAITDIYASSTDVGNVGTGEDDLHTKTTAANTLAATGDWLEVNTEVTVTYTSTETNRYRLYFAGTVIFDSGAVNTDAGTYNFSLSAKIWWRSATTAHCRIDVVDNNSIFAAAPLQTSYVDLTGKDWTTTNVLKETGECSTANDNRTVSNVMTVTSHKAP